MLNKFITTSFDYLRSVPQLLTDIFKKHVESDLRIRNKPRVWAGAKQSDIFKAETDKQTELNDLKIQTLQKLADVRQEAHNKQDTATRYLDRELGARVPTADVQQNLLIEAREQKAWTRIKPLLDRHNDIDSLTGELKTLVSGFILTPDASPGAYDSSDYDSISAMKKELPFYIRGKFSEKEAEIYTEQSINAIEDALAEIRPEYSEAVNLKKELRTGMIQLNTAINYVKYAVEQNEPEVIIPVWEKGETATIS